MSEFEGAMEKLNKEDSKAFMLTFLCNWLDGSFEILHELVLTFCIVGWMYHEIFYELMLTFCVVSLMD